MPFRSHFEHFALTCRTMQKHMQKLVEVPKGQNYRIVNISCEVGIHERLVEMGISKGQIINTQGRAPFGGPWIVQVGSTLLALREGEIQCIQVEAL